MKKILSLLLVASIFILASCAWSSNDIINPDSDFIYFYGATCPHCQELNAKIKDEDLFSTVSVEKREVYYNNDNRDLFLATTNKLGLSESEVGVPFVMDRATGEFAVWVDPALTLLKSRLWETGEESQDEENSVEIENTTSTSMDTEEGSGSLIEDVIEEINPEEIIPSTGSWDTTQD